MATTLLVLLTRGAALVALPALTALIVLTTLRNPILRRVLGWWPIYCVGAMCYSLYLYHFFVISAVGRFFSSVIGWQMAPGWGLAAFALIVMPAVIGVCTLPYLLIERPFMVWRPGKTRLIGAFRRPSK